MMLPLAACKNFPKAFYLLWIDDLFCFEHLEDSFSFSTWDKDPEENCREMRIKEKELKWGRERQTDRERERQKKTGKDRDTKRKKGLKNGNIDEEIEKDKKRERGN